MDLAVGTVVANTYEILGPLGRGGMGELFRARNIRTERRIALKLLRPDNKHRADAIERFRREARAAGMINSDHVTQVLDVEDDPKLGIAIAFELLEGESLLERLRRTGPMDIDTVHPIVEQMLRGLADAHRVDIIHRDLKPSNVFLEKRPDGTTRVKILDFGISKLPKQIAKTTLTEPGQSLGSFMFMPPEQIQRAAAVDARADIYACGTLVFQAMTGHLPYSARNMVELVTQKTSGLARTLAQAAGKSFPQPLEQWVAKCLALSPNDRFQTAQDAVVGWATLKVAAPVMSERRGGAAQTTGPQPGGPISHRTPGLQQGGAGYASAPQQPFGRGKTLQLSNTSPEVISARQQVQDRERAQQTAPGYSPPSSPSQIAQQPHPLAGSGSRPVMSASGANPIPSSGHPIAQSGPRSAPVSSPASAPPAAPTKSVPAWLIAVAIVMVLAALAVSAAVVYTLMSR